MNSELLKSYIVKNGDNQPKLSNALGISLSNLNAKINEKSASFRQNEIISIKNRYRLTAEEVDTSF